MIQRSDSHTDILLILHWALIPKLCLRNFILQPTGVSLVLGFPDLAFCRLRDSLHRFAHSHSCLGLRRGGNSQNAR